MNKRILFLCSLLSLILSTGCSLIPDSDDESSALASDSVEISGSVEFPEEILNSLTPDAHRISGQVGLSESNFRCFINGSQVTLIKTSLNSTTFNFNGVVVKSSEFEVKVTNINSAVIMKGYYPEAKRSSLAVNTDSTARALLYEEKRKQSLQSFSFQDFEKNLTVEHVLLVEREVRKTVIKQSFLNGFEAITTITEIVLRVTQVITLIPFPDGILPLETSTSSTTTTTTTSTSTSTGIVPDATLAINEGADTTAVATVTLNLFNVKGEGVLTMSVDGGAYETLNLSRLHTLTGSEGEKSVTVKLKDDKGIESLAITDTITWKSSVSTPLTLVKISPETTEGAISPLQKFSLEFSDTLDASTANSTNITLDQNASYTLSTSGKLATVTVMLPLKNGTAHLLTLKTGIKSSSGVALSGELTKSYTTGYSLFATTNEGSMSQDFKGNLKFWGQRTNGSIGATSTVQIHNPLVHPEVGSLTLLVGGYDFFLGVKSDGNLVGFGYRNYGAWGDGSSGSNGSMATPTLINHGVPGTIKQIAAGYVNSAILNSLGNVYVTGENGNGTVGNASSTNVTVFTQTVATFTGVTAIDLSYGHMLALKSDKTVWAWGINSNGECGLGNTIDPITSPSQVVSLDANFHTLSQIAAGYSHSLALKEDGTVWAWGKNTNGEIGLGNTTSPQTQAIQVPGLTDILEISARYFTSYALKKDGTLYAWGDNGFLGVGDNNGATDRLSPIAITISGGTPVFITQGGYTAHGFAVTREGAVNAWGNGGSYQLGNDGFANVGLPTQISGTPIY